MAERETWEIDPEGISLDDYIVLERGFGKGSDTAELKRVFALLVTNRTEQEIGALPLRDLNEALDKAMEAFRELAVPKAPDTP